MRILGIDPGYATTGFGILEAGRGSVQLLNYGTITTPTTLTFPERLVVLYDDMVQLIETVKPDAVAVEELFWGHNVTTGIGVSHGRGVILLAICKSGAPLFEYTPNQVKQAVVGYGGADKHQVQMMVRMLAMGETKLFGMCTLITLGIFCVIYGLVYAFTAKSYYNIVRVKA